MNYYFSMPFEEFCNLFGNMRFDEILLSRLSYKKFFPLIVIIFLLSFKVTLNIFGIQVNG